MRLRVEHGAVRVVTHRRFAQTVRRMPERHLELGATDRADLKEPGHQRGLPHSQCCSNAAFGLLIDQNHRCEILACSEQLLERLVPSRRHVFDASRRVGVRAILRAGSRVEARP